MSNFTVVQRKRQKYIDELMEWSTGLDESLVERIFVYSECLVRQETNDISEHTFIVEMAQQFNMTNLNMLTLIFGVVKCPRTVKRALTLDEYCKLMCTFLSPDLDSKINFTFRVYDIDHDKRLSRSEVIALLKPTIPKNDEEHEDMLKDLIDIVMKIVDVDGNGSIDLEEYRGLVKTKNILYMDLLGQCLPTERDILAFKNKLLSRTVLEVKEYFQAQGSNEIFGTLRPQVLNSEYYPITLEF